MPNAPARPCTYPGCGRLTLKGRCDQHRRTEAKQYDKARGSAHERGYTSQWTRYRAAWLRDHPLCGDRRNGTSTQHSYCAEQGYVVAASVVDHIKPHRGDMGLFWDAENHQSLCAPCHNRKTATEDGGFGNRPKGELGR